MVRLAGIEPTMGLNLRKAAPPLDFTKSSGLKNSGKRMTKVEDIPPKYRSGHRDLKNGRTDMIIDGT